MANTTDFISSVYDELRRQLGMGGTDPSSFMLMAWPGYALDPSDFKPANAATGPYDPDVAREAVSELANIAPTFSRMRFDNSGFQIDDLYEIILSSAIPSGATPETVGANPIYRLFSDASFEFMQARRGAKDDPNSFYYPCNATPNRWYDETVSDGWTKIELTQSDIKPAAGSEFAKAGGVALSEAEVWRLQPSVEQRSKIGDKLRQLTLNEATTVKATAVKAATVKAAAVNAAAVNAAPLRTLAATVAAPSPAVRAALSPAVRLAPVASMSSVASVATARPLTPTQPAAATAAVSVVAPKVQALYTRSAAPANVLGTLDVSRADLVQRNLGLAKLGERLIVKQVIDQALPAKPPSAATDGFKVSFEFCRVNIERPWLKLALLKTKNWWMFDTSAGEYSTGDPDANPGTFPLLSTSLIVIRNLQITANWKQDDPKNLGAAASFGFFDLRGGSINNSTIEVKGLQVIGWACTLMPRLPPLPPP